MSEALILRSGSTISNKVPEFTYTGSYKFIDDGDGNWRIKFLTSGKLTFTKLNSAKSGIDVFLVGGGGAGGRYGGGGAGGYTFTGTILSLEKNKEYSIVVGAGGTSPGSTNANGTSGGTSSAFGLKANGGGLGYRQDDGGRDGYGGSGGGGGYDGYNGSGTGHGQRSYPGPNGEKGTTREFGESGGAMYSGGGENWNKGNTGDTGGVASGGGSKAVNGGTNTGGGGGASYIPGSGGSGIVIIRNRRA